MTNGAVWKERRQAMGLSQTALAQRVGVARSTIGRWETGEIAPDPEHLAALMAALGMDREPEPAPRTQAAAQDDPGTPEDTPGTWMAEALRHPVEDLDREPDPEPEPDDGIDSARVWMAHAIRQMEEASREAPRVREPEPVPAPRAPRKRGLFSWIMGRKTAL